MTEESDDTGILMESHNIILNHETVDAIQNGHFEINLLL